jgi:hypothetical protein
LRHLRCSGQGQQRSERQNLDPVAHKLGSKSAHSNIHPDVKVWYWRVVSQFEFLEVAERPQE